ncbi:hypothetical protein [Nannocystis pusilla]|uniref:hypothetical protein n=1 Tax=Nannocystis pusilla TaxID=889268 RepID=UPI003DA20CFA
MSSSSMMRIDGTNHPRDDWRRRCSFCSSLRIVCWAARICGRAAAMASRSPRASAGPCARKTFDGGLDFDELGRGQRTRPIGGEAGPQLPRGLDGAVAAAARAQEVAPQRLDELVAQRTVPVVVAEVGRHPGDVLAEVVLERGDLLGEVGDRECHGVRAPAAQAPAGL